MVSHDPSAAAWADRVVFVADATLRVAAIYDRAAGLGDVLVDRAVARHGPRANVEGAWGAWLIVGVATASPRSPSSTRRQ